jgi:uncharacterized protein DUF4136
MKRILVAGVVFLALSAVAIAVDTKTDYDHSVDFSKYRTFAWKAATPENNGVVTNSLVLSRIHDSVAEELRSKGLTENRTNPDFYVVTHVGAENLQDIDYWPPFGGWRHWSWMGPDVIVQRYVEGTIILDMVDAGTNRLIWRSVSTETASDLVEVQSEKKVDKMVESALKHFPPERTLRSKR